MTKITEQLTHIKPLLGDHPNPIIISDQIGFVVYVNAAGCNFYNFNSTEINGLNLNELLNITNQPAIDTNASQAFALIGNSKLEIPVEVEVIQVFDSLIIYKFKSISELLTAKTNNELSIFSVFVEHAPSAIALFDKDMNYLLASKRWYQDYGILDQEIIGKCHYDVFPEINNMPQWKEMHQRCLEGEVIINKMDQFNRESGEIDFLQYELRPWYNNEGEIGGIIMFTEVITNMVKLQHRLSKRINQQDILLSVTELFASTHLSKSDVLTQLANMACDVIHLKENPSAEITLQDGSRFLSRSFKKGTQQFTIKVGQGTKNEGKITIHCCDPILLKEEKDINNDERDIFRAIANMLNNYLERQSIFETLEENESRLSFLFNNLKDLVCLHDANGTYTEVSESIYTITGYSKDEILGQDPYDFFHPDDVDRVRKDSHYKVLSGAKRTQIEYRFKHKDGRYIWFDTTTELVKNEDNEIIGLITSSRDVTEKIEAEQARRRSDERFKEIFSTIDQGIVYQNHEGKINLANRAAEKILGLSIDQLTGKTSFDPEWKSIHPDGSKYDAHEHPAVIALRTGIQVKKEIMGVYKPAIQDFVWLNVSAYPVFDHASEKPISVYVTFADITNEYKSTKALKASEEKFKAVFDNAFQFMGMLDPDGTVIDVNETALKFAGVQLSDVKGYKLWDGPWWLNNEQSLNIEKGVHKAQNGQFVRFDLEVQGSNERRIIVDFSLRPVTNNDGKVLFIIPEGRNNTEKIELEKSLFRSNAEMYSILESVSYTLIFSNLQRKIERVNSKTYDMFGFKESEILGESTEIFYKDKEKSRSLHLDEDFNNPAKPKIEFEAVCIRKDNSEFIARIVFVPVRNKENEVIGYLKQIEDITAQKEAETLKNEFYEKLEHTVEERTIELQQAKKELEKSLEIEKELNLLKSHFVSSASHQFRTPLTVIQSNTELLTIFRGQIFTTQIDKFNLFVSRIQNQVNKMTELMDDLLLFGKISSGKLVPEMQPLDLIALCKDLREQYELIVEYKRKLVIKVVGTPQLVNLDKKLITHALNNLVSNAFKYSTKQEPLIKLIYKSNYVDIIVQDQGIGISDEDLKNLFQPFYRGNNVNDIQGTGLGLSIAKEYIDAQGGALSITSEINKGTSLKIRFPLNIP